MHTLSGALEYLSSVRGHAYACACPILHVSYVSTTCTSARRVHAPRPTRRIHRLAEEKAKKAKAKKDKKEFQDRVKKQEAGKELLQQHFKHEHAEQDAEHALWEAKRQADLAGKWTVSK